ncbi:Uncharacterized protein dnl_13960 [Desulfonema limicola]|uniref:Uncharacterized protein n=1 Tax=Desulfonema limicola TaxID=45656 RepID=A0A975B5G9_9BACT|nr:Uncharacterized protein dnl_13960 [Desulfonema limicola]
MQEQFLAEYLQNQVFAPAFNVLPCPVCHDFFWAWDFINFFIP